MSPVSSDDNDTPSKRTAFAKGIDFSSNATEARSNSSRPEIASGNDWLRETISKSANLIFNVTVRPLDFLSFRSDARPFRSMAEVLRPWRRIQSNRLKTCFRRRPIFGFGWRAPAVRRRRAISNNSMRPTCRRFAAINSSVWLRMSDPVKMPRLCILAFVAGPMPWNLPTGSVSTKPGPISGVMSYRPLGLR
jgi:hypothetical protein